jgi:hypothetical protein
MAVRSTGTGMLEHELTLYCERLSVAYGEITAGRVRARQPGLSINASRPSFTLDPKAITARPRPPHARPGLTSEPIVSARAPIGVAAYGRTCSRQLNGLHSPGES